jgi:hypothetical protein
LSRPEFGIPSSPLDPCTFAAIERDPLLLPGPDSQNKAWPSYSGLSIKREDPFASIAPSYGAEEYSRLGNSPSTISLYPDPALHSQEFFPSWSDFLSFNYTDIPDNFTDAANLSGPLDTENLLDSFASESEALHQPENLSHGPVEEEQYPPQQWLASVDSKFQNEDFGPSDDDGSTLVDVEDASDATSEITDFSGSDWDATAEEYRVSILSQGLKAFGDEVLRRAATDIEALFSCCDAVISHCGPAGSSSCSCAGYQNTASTPCPNATFTRKRQRESDGSDLPDDGQDDGDDEQGKRRKVDPLSRPNIFPGVRYACPYFKHDPVKYANCRACAGPGWPTVHRAK